MHYNSTVLASGNNLRIIVSAIILSIGLAGCGKHGGSKDATQVAAKVNGSEISVHQINQVLAHTPGVTQENAAQARKEILEKLISQQIAVDKATEAKLDRSPAVMMALEAARRDVLSRAYLEQLGAASAKVTDEESRNYFDTHPELFANRRIYNLQDIVMQRDDKLVTELQGQVSQGKSIQDIAAWLKGNNVKIGTNADTRAAEQLPLDLLPKLASLADGQTSVIELGDALHVIHVVSSQLAPLDQTAAIPRIKQYLGNQRGQEAIVSEMKKLRDAAKVEYLGEFSGDKPQQSKAAVPAADAKATEASSANQSAANESIKKGAAGL